MTLADAVPPPPPAPARPRRRAAAVAGTVAVAAIVGGGAWAWHVWSAQGPQPAEALPASTLAYIGVDLDPAGGQKVAAYDALRSVPSLEKELGLGSKDDLRESLVDTLAEDGGCDLPWSQIKEWAGDRAALAVVPVDGPEPVVALQVSDADAARSGLARIARDCGDDFGFTVGERWAILAATEEIARQVRSDAEGATLAEDAGFQELVGDAGDPGVLTVYAAPAAGRALLEASEGTPFLAFFPVGSLDPIGAMVLSVTFLADFDEPFVDEAEGMGPDGEFEEPTPEEMGLTPEQARLFERMEDYPDLSRAEQKQLDEEMDKAFGGPGPVGADEFGGEELSDEELEERMDVEMDDLFEVPDEVREQLEDFSGLGGVARFHDGGLELELVGDPFLTGYEGMYDGTDARAAVAALPADTAIAFGAGFADGWAEHAITRDGLFAFGQSEAEVVDGFEEATGLSPADLEALGGDAFAFAAKAGFTKALDSDSPEEVPLAVRVTGDTKTIEAALAKLAASDDLGVFAKSVRTDDGVVIGPNTSYLAELADPERTLGDTDAFEDATGESDAMVISYADFDRDWLPSFSEGDLSAADAEALGAAGLVVTEDGDRQRFLLRLTLD
ncbi:MAG TPA: hypothetical protein VNS46_21140 [Nocardioides sp.]|nr:hypothetical protein [Nocardioides sp.]